MKNHFKKHINELMRYQTSLGRDFENGLRLDRNERVSNFPKEIVEDIFSKFQAYSFSASPDTSLLYQKVAKFLDIPCEMIFITSGITEGIRILYEALTIPGENVIVLHPTYPFYYIYSKMYQIEYRKFSFKQDLSVDWDSFYKNINDNTSLVMIPNPNLPIESVFSIDEVRTIADECKKHNTILAIDEAYHYFGAPTVIGLLGEYDNLVVMRTFSKAFGLAGIRLGFMISSKDNIAYLSKTRSLVETNTFSSGIAEYMLDHPEIIRDHVREVKKGSKYLQAELTKLNLRWFGGNYTNGLLLFLNNEKEVDSLVKYLKEKYIYIRGAFEEPFNRCVRISIGAKEIMAIFVDSLKEWLLGKK